MDIGTLGVHEAKEVLFIVLLLKSTGYGAALGLFSPIMAIVRATIKYGWRGMEVRSAMDSAAKGLIIVMILLFMLSFGLTYVTTGNNMVTLKPVWVLASGALGVFFGAAFSIALFSGTLRIPELVGRVRNSMHNMHKRFA